MTSGGAVVHVVVAGEVGGAERMLADLTRAPTERPHSVALFTPNERLRALVRDARVSLDDRGACPEGPLRYLARSLGPLDVSWLVAVLRKRRASIVHVHTFGSQVLGTRAAARLGARVVRTEHSTRVYDDPSCWPFSRWSLRRADVAVCVSVHVRTVAEARARWAAPKLRVVPNGVDLERFARAPLPATPEGAPRFVPRFVTVGRLDRRKGLDLALNALAEVPGAELDIVGDGEERASLEQLARHLGVAPRVRFCGFQADVRQALARGHVALSSARAEGLGISLLEAMAMGRPVVALPTGGVPEIVHDGATGWLARDASPAALARAMREAASLEIIRTRGERARAFVEAKYSLGAMRDGYERIYAHVERSAEPGAR